MSFGEKPIGKASGKCSLFLLLDIDVRDDDS